MDLGREDILTEDANGSDAIPDLPAEKVPPTLWPHYRKLSEGDRRRSVILQNIRQKVDDRLE